MNSPEKTAFATSTVAVRDSLTKRQADTFHLVLSSADIPCRVARTLTGWQIQVPLSAESSAAATIDAYLSENEDPVESHPVPVWPIVRTWAGAGMALFLIAVHLAVNISGQGTAFRSIFSASAANILNGEFYRITTALMLHADGLHLIGNVAGLALFATAVCGMAGFGAGSLMILVAGMTGNLFNAFLFGNGHQSIGASTAVFGAVGIIVAQLFIIKWRHPGRRLYAWLPLGGGVALLAVLGAGINTDITAHFFGYVSGCGIGIIFTSMRKAPPAKGAQYAYLLAAIVLVVTSCLSPILFRS
jgi:membrane associated rhomboid family serine protease